MQCIFIVELSVSALNKMHYLVSNNCHPLAQSFLKKLFSVSGKRYLCVMFASMKKNASFLFFGVLCFFTGLFLSILYKQLSSYFQISDHSRLPFWLGFDNLSKNMTICSECLDIFVTSNLQLPRPLKLKPHLAPYTHDYPNTLLFETKGKIFSSRFFEKI